MTLSRRTLTQTLVALAIAASIVSAVPQGAPDAAYAANADHETALIHSHRMVAHTVRCPDCSWYHLDVSIQQFSDLYAGKDVTTRKARRQDATAVEAAWLAQKLSAILTPYRLSHIPLRHCNIFCPHG
jgi:hypothetical protein